MKYLLSIFLILGSLSCGGNTTTARPSESRTLANSPAPKTNSQSAQADANPAPNLPAPNIPKDAEWTILAAVFAGDDHAAQARAARANLINSTKMRDWYTVAGE